MPGAGSEGAVDVSDNSLSSLSPSTDLLLWLILNILATIKIQPGQWRDCAADNDQTHF